MTRKSEAMLTPATPSLISGTTKCRTGSMARLCRRKRPRFLSTIADPCLATEPGEGLWYNDGVRAFFDGHCHRLPPRGIDLSVDPASECSFCPVFGAFFLVWEHTRPCLPPGDRNSAEITGMRESHGSSCDSRESR